MVLLQQLTREQVRVAVGRNLRVVRLLTATANGTATTFRDASVRGGDDNHNGKWLRFTGPSNNDGETRQVDDYDGTSTVGLFTIRATGSALTNPATGDTAELWEEEYDPRDIDAYINEVITQVSHRVGDPEESLALHGDGQQARFDIPAQFNGIQNIEFRTSVESFDIHNGDSVFDESVDSDFTVTRDQELFKPGSVKFVIAGTVSAGDLASDSIGSVDLSGKTHVELQVYATVAVALDDLRLILSATANGASETEALAIPALVARTKTFVRIALANPENDDAIISVALEYNANPAANTVFLTRIKGIDDNSAVYTRLGKQVWAVEDQTRDLVLKRAGVVDIGSRLIKIIGSGMPVQLNADATVVEAIPEQYLIYQTTGLAMLSSGGGRQVDPDEGRSGSGFWFRLAAEIPLRMPQGTRRVPN